MPWHPNTASQTAARGQRQSANPSIGTGTAFLALGAVRSLIAISSAALGTWAVSWKDWWSPSKVHAGQRQTGSRAPRERGRNRRAGGPGPRCRAWPQACMGHTWRSLRRGCLGDPDASWWGRRGLGLWVVVGSGCPGVTSAGRPARGVCPGTRAVPPGQSSVASLFHTQAPPDMQEREEVTGSAWPTPRFGQKGDPIEGANQVPQISTQRRSLDLLDRND